MTHKPKPESGELDELIVKRNDAAKMYVAPQSQLWFEARRDGGRVRSKKNAVNGAFHAGFNFALESLRSERDAACARLIKPTVYISCCCGTANFPYCRATIV